MILKGVAAGFACMIMWIYLTGIVILAGAKINAMLYFYMNKRKMQKHGNNKSYTKGK